ncbi:MAG: circularly permuted type 2 ATP-grasp protein [Candidatus Omnitrophica bacterium]|nr:circularly permuted type 2 ATP-grasp protein [Candidatus Omnitrophota bacterium]
MINQQFDNLIQSHPAKIRDAILFYQEELAKRDCKFGEEVIPSFLKPVFLSRDQSQEISYVLNHIVNILDKVSRLYFTHPDLREFFYINKQAAELIDIDHGYSRNVVISRPDSFLKNGLLRFVEFNCDSPAGAGYSDVTEDVLKELFPLQQLNKSYFFPVHNRMQHLLDALLKCYGEFSGQNKKPNIAIVDWKEVRTLNEFRIQQAFFKDKGYDTIIADPRELKFVDGRLEHNGFPIDLVYRRVIFRELMSHLDEVQGFIDAYRAGKVCVVNPLRSRLASNKAILSIITNQKKYKGFFTEEENAIIKKHVPWTRRVMDIETHFEDNEIFLKKHIINHRDHLVLKPADSYGGKDVVIGLECPQDQWEALVNRIIDEKEDWVVQRYVDVTEMTIPVVNNGTVELQQKWFNINPYTFNGKYAGSVARLSDKRVINVSAGGGLVPVVEYSEKCLA